MQKFESNEQFRQEETIRLLNWVSNNKTAWDEICGKSNRVLSPDDYWHYFTLLKGLKFYDILFVFTLNNQESIATYDFFENLGIRKLSELWSENIIEQFEEFILQEVERTNKRYEKLENLNE